MQRTRSPRGRLAAWAWLALGLAVWSNTARAQAPQPSIPDIDERSGLLTRFQRIEPLNPPDPDRDAFYDTRYGDPPNYRWWPNCIKNGGFYGLRWTGKCTATFYPYFYGSPGNMVTEECVRRGPLFRHVGSFFHPFRPICHYYDQGCYVPVYDLDPIVPGPGPTGWFPWYWRNPRGG
jgi:hypothetical protein